MSNHPWYHEGLRFRCTECGQCCTGAPGFVWVNQAEIDALAALCGCSTAEFEKLYVRKVGIRRSLREYRNGDCVFFDNTARRCTVYEARPRQCRSWPFWSSNVQTPAAWEQTCRQCPGCGSGELHTCQQIQTRVEMIRI